MRQKLNIPCITSILFVILSTYVLFKIVGFDSNLDKLHIEGFKETKHNYSKSNVGACTPNDSFQYHDCEIKNPESKDYKQLIETYPTYELSKDVTDKALQDAIKRIRTVGGLENLMKLKVNPRDPEGMTPKIRTYHRNFNDNSYTRQPRTNLSWNLLVDASEGQVSEADAEFADDNGILLKDNSRVWMLENLQDFDFYYSFEKGAMGSFKVGGT